MARWCLGTYRHLPEQVRVTEGNWMLNMRGTAILTQLPIDCIKVALLDYMHLVFLGVAKKLLMQWVLGPARLGPATRDKVSQLNVSLQDHIPREFSWKPRSLLELDHWKATEFCLSLPTPVQPF